MGDHGGLQSFVGVLASVLVDHLPSARDKSHLSMVSRSLYVSIVPHLYGSWKFNGIWKGENRLSMRQIKNWSSDAKKSRLKTQPPHPFVSLRLFIRTILENTDLASQVRILDIQNWSRKSNGYNEGKLLFSPDWRMEAPLVVSAIASLSIEGASSAKLVESVETGSEDAILAVLAAKLPNLRVLYMKSLTEAFFMQNLIHHAAERGLPSCFERLEIVSIDFVENNCYSIHPSLIHYNAITAFLRLRNLHTLRVFVPAWRDKILRSHHPLYRKTGPLGGAKLLSDHPLYDEDMEKSSSITTSGSLKSLHLAQLYAADYRRGYEWTIPQTLYRLLESTKDSVTDVSIDFGEIYHRIKTQDQKQELQNAYTWQIKQMRSLSDFTALKKLAISPIALCRSSHADVKDDCRMLDHLPPSLESFKLLCQLSDEAEWLERGIWYKELLHLARRAPEQLPNLVKVTVETLDTPGRVEVRGNYSRPISGRNLAVGAPNRQTSATERFPELREAFLLVSVGFNVKTWHNQVDRMAEKSPYSVYVSPPPPRSQPPRGCFPPFSQ